MCRTVLLKNVLINLKRPVCMESSMVIIPTIPYVISMQLHITCSFEMKENTVSQIWDGMSMN